MKFYKSLRLVTAGVVSIATLAISSPYLAAEAQRRGSLKRFPLLENSVYRYFTSGRSANLNCCGRPVNITDREVIVSRQLRTSQFQIRSDVSSYTVLTTEVDQEKFDNLSLQMVTSDQSALYNTKLRLVIWQSGNEKIIYDNITPGSVLDYDLNIDYSAGDSPGDISIELQCESATTTNGCFIYFTEAELSPIGNFVSGQTPPNERPEAPRREPSSTSRSDGSSLGDLVESFLDIFR